MFLAWTSKARRRCCSRATGPVDAVACDTRDIAEETAFFAARRRSRCAGGGTAIAQALSSMQSVTQQVAVVLVSASETGEHVRRELVARGVAMLGATGTLSALRRTLVRERFDAPVILCITLDDATMRRHGRFLARLLEDRRSFATPLHAIGLIAAQWRNEWASTGCDAWAGDLTDLERLIDGFAAMNATQQTDATRLQRPTPDLLTRSRVKTREMDLR
jgi:hypothetical protein